MAKGHIRARGPGAWELKFDSGVDPVTGQRITRYKTVRGAKRDAQRELRTILTSIDGGTFADPNKMMLAEWLRQWLAEAQHSVARKTLERYREIVELHLIPALGAVPLAKLQPVHIQAYYAHALASGRRDGSGGLSGQTVVHHDRVLPLPPDWAPGSETAKKLRTWGDYGAQLILAALVGRTENFKPQAGDFVHEQDDPSMQWVGRLGPAVIGRIKKRIAASKDSQHG